MGNLSTAAADLHPALARELRAFLRGVGYHTQSTAEVLAHVAAHDTGISCPSLDDGDVVAVEEIIQRHYDKQADEGYAGWVEREPADWPAWTDRHVFMPTEADRQWAASFFGAATPDERPVRVRLDRRPGGYSEADADHVTCHGCV